MIKPRIKTRRWLASGERKACKVSSVAELLAVYERVAPLTDVLVAQEWVPGAETSLYSCYVYFDRGSQPLITFVSRKVRQWPPETGVSSHSVECRNEIVRREALRVFGGSPTAALATWR